MTSGSAGPPASQGPGSAHAGPSWGRATKSSGDAKAQRRAAQRQSGHDTRRHATAHGRAHLTDTKAFLFEAVAALEYTGRPRRASRSGQL
jgi:hypothetical protein